MRVWLARPEKNPAVITVREAPPTGDEDLDTEAGLGFIVNRKSGKYRAYSAAYYSDEFLHDPTEFDSLLAAVRWLINVAKHA